MEVLKKPSGPENVTRKRQCKAAELLAWAGGATELENWTWQSESSNRTSEVGPECSMCGDVGFSQNLFRCRRCLHRYQHTYCSNSYPRISREPDQQTCDWCLTPKHGSNNPGKQLHLISKTKRKASELPKLYDKSLAASEALGSLLEVAEEGSPASQTVNQGKKQISPTLSRGARNDNAPEKDVHKTVCCSAPDKSKVVISRWRHFTRRKLQAAPTREGGRRYKLLSDV